MLLLDRKPGTSVVITTLDGNEIKVTVISNDSFGVKLGFEADKNVNIVRSEVIDRQK